MSSSFGKMSSSFGKITDCSIPVFSKVEAMLNNKWLDSFGSDVTDILKRIEDQEPEVEIRFKGGCYIISGSLRSITCIHNFLLDNADSHTQLQLQVDESLLNLETDGIRRLEEDHDKISSIESYGKGFSSLSCSSGFQHLSNADRDEYIVIEDDDMGQTNDDVDVNACNKDEFPSIDFGSEMLADKTSPTCKIDASERQMHQNFQESVTCDEDDKIFTNQNIQESESYDKDDKETFNNQNCQESVSCDEDDKEIFKSQNFQESVTCHKDDDTFTQQHFQESETCDEDDKTFTNQNIQKSESCDKDDKETFKNQNCQESVSCDKDDKETFKNQDSVTYDKDDNETFREQMDKNATPYDKDDNETSIEQMDKNATPYDKDDKETVKNWDFQDSVTYDKDDNETFIEQKDKNSTPSDKDDNDHEIPENTCGNSGNADVRKTHVEQKTPECATEAQLVDPDIWDYIEAKKRDQLLQGLEIFGASYVCDVDSESGLYKIRMIFPPNYHNLQETMSLAREQVARVYDELFCTCEIDTIDGQFNMEDFPVQYVHTKFPDVFVKCYDDNVLLIGPKASIRRAKKQFLRFIERQM